VTKVPASGEASLASGAKISAFLMDKKQKFAKGVNRKGTPKTLWSSIQGRPGLISSNNSVI